METELMKISHINYLEKRILILKNKLKTFESLMENAKIKNKDLVKKSFT